MNTFNLEEDETSSSQTKKHKWTRDDGKILTSTFLLPPWDNLKAEEKNDDGSIESTILLSPTLQYNKEITIRDLVAQENWGNYYLQKGIQHLHRTFDKQNSDFKKSKEERKTVMDEQGSRWSIVLSKINEFGLGMNALSKSVSESIPINDHYQSMIDTISSDSKNTRRYLRTITEKLSVLNKTIEQQPETTQPPHLSSYPTYQPIHKTKMIKVSYYNLLNLFPIFLHLRIFQCPLHLLPILSLDFQMKFQILCTFQPLSTSKIRKRKRKFSLQTQKKNQRKLNHCILFMIFLVIPKLIQLHLNYWQKWTVNIMNLQVQKVKQMNYTAIFPRVQNAMNVILQSQVLMISFTFKFPNGKTKNNGDLHQNSIPVENQSRQENSKATQFILGP